jgi:hypothetical protein
MLQTRLMSKDFRSNHKWQRALAAILEVELTNLDTKNLGRSTMSYPAASRSLRRLARQASASSSIPLFLLPCLPKSHQARSFSSNHASNSRIGGAAISVPPEVSLRFFELPKSNIRSRKKDVPVSAVEVAGPLGTSLKDEFGRSPC